MNNLEKAGYEAYSYLFPLVFNIQQIKRYAKVGVEGTGGVGYNAFSHASYLADADSNFVSVNNDTIYSLAGVNLTGGPLLLELPESKSKYYVGQFIDAWSNNFAYVGTRGTNGEHSKIYLVPPKFTGTLPEDYPIIEFPTNLAVITMRYSIDGAEDLINVQKLQQQTTLTPVAELATTYVEVPDGSNGHEGLDFFNEAVVYKNAYPASVEDQQTIEHQFEILGLANYAQLTPNVLEILKKVNDNGLAYLRDLLEKNKEKSDLVNGWDMNLQAFDYNNAYFEIGAKSDAKYIIADRQKAILTRSLSALSALWGNNAYEAAYFFLWEDADEQPLYGTNNYEINFKKLPPVHAFWSLTMYDMPDFYLVANELNRYSIGDRTEGIQYNDDGSLTLYIGADKPTDPKKIANWLPAPTGQFRPIMRLYLPKAEVFEKGFSLSPIKKL